MGIRIKYFITIIVTVLFAQNIYGQQVKSTNEKNSRAKIGNGGNLVKNLGIGDRLPDVQMLLLDNGNIRKVRTAELRSSLVILDFWDTYCSSCIRAFPRLDSLQRLFGDKLLILPVNYQERNLVSSFYSNNRFLKKNNVKPMSVVEDKLLGQYFKHGGVPHEVWIYKGVVKGITASDYVTEENIQSILTGREVSWPIKNEKSDFDYSMPLMSNKNKELVPRIGFPRSFSLFGLLDGVTPKTGGTVDSTNKNIRDYCINQPIIQLYYSAMSIQRPVPFSPAINRIFLEVKDSSIFFFDKKKNYQAEWDRSHLFSYESILPISMSKFERSNLIVTELNKFLGLNGRMENHTVNCLVITQIGRFSKQESASTFFRNKTIKELIEWLDTSNLMAGGIIFPPIIDETNYTGLLSMDEWHDLSSLRTQLLKQGFDIHEAKREIQLFTLTELN